MRLTVANCYTLVEGANEDELDTIALTLAFKVKSKDGRTDVVHRLFNTVNSTFPTGYLPHVWTALKKRGSAIDLVDIRVVPCVPDWGADIEWLRHHPYAKVDPITHQVAALEAAVAKKRGTLHIPTAGGKTEIAVGLTKVLPCRWLFVVPSGDLLGQTAERFELRLDEPIGRIGDGQWSVERVTVATFQTLHARITTDEFLALTTEVEGLICDEAHTLPADTYYAAVMRFKKAYFRIAMSATPMARGDLRSMRVVAATGRIIHRVWPKELIDAGIIAQPLVRFVPVYQELLVKANDHPWGDDAGKPERPDMAAIRNVLIVRSKLRNQTLVEIAKRAVKPALFFVREIPHGKHVEKLLGKAGIPTEFVYGNDHVAVRTAAVRRLERGEVDVLVCSVIFQQGIDIPTLGSIINGSGMRSAIATIQRTGRGMRTADGKDTVEIWDIDDCGCRILERQTAVRKGALRSEGYEISRLEIQ